MNVVRTPKESLEGLPDFPFESSYTEIDGLRIAYLDEGEGKPVVFFHGEPTWSYLWRKVIPPVRDAGFRCVAPDYFGFGRSDKPTDIGWYSYDKHTESLIAFVEALDLRDMTVVVQDWGGPLGFRLCVERPDRVARLVVLNTGIGARAPNDDWLRFQAFVRRVGTEIVPGQLIRISLVQPVDDEIIAAYDAPFPTPESKTGIVMFPELVPTSSDHPSAPAMLAARDRLRTWEAPALVLFSDSDPIFSRRAAETMAALLPNAELAPPVEGAGHFLQEDRGARIAADVSALARRTS